MSDERRVHFEHSTPIFRVEDIPRSLEFYVGKMGFENAEWGDHEFTCITRDGAAIYLCRGSQGHGGAWAWFGVDDVRKLQRECEAAGVALRMPPANFPWALELHIEDPDANVIRFGSEPEGEQ